MGEFYTFSPILFLLITRQRYCKVFFNFLKDVKLKVSFECHHHHFLQAEFFFYILFSFYIDFENDSKEALHNL